MTDQDITLTLPLTSQEFWVLVIAASVIGLSILTFRLGHTRHQANMPSEKWLTSALTVFTGILAPLWAALIVLVIYGLWRLAWSFPSLSDGTDLRWHVLSLVGLLTALGGLLGTPLALIRITLTERQTNATEQGLITDRITKAVEGLGAEKTVKHDGDESTEPNLEVRIGALFSLERISQDSARDHIQIMEILCAYIRNNADRHSPTLPDEDPPEGWREWGKNNRTHPPLDVDTALKIIERRSDDRKKIEKAYNDGEGYRPGLERAPLHALDLGARDLTGAVLSYAQLQGASLNFTKLKGANLMGARLQGANLMHTYLQGANLSFAKLQRAALMKTELQGAHISFAEFQGANFWRTKFDGATVTDTTDFTGSAFRDVNFSEIDISLHQRRTAFGDGHTILPDGKGPDSPDWPAHWPKEKLNPRDFETAWRAWQAEIGFQPDENP